jgi:outer membrane protein TolC
LKKLQKVRATMKRRILFLSSGLALWLLLWSAAGTAFDLSLFRVEEATGEQAGNVEEDVGQDSLWAGIEVLDLPTAKRLAMAENPSIDAVEARVRQAESRLRQAASAWWPNMQISGSYSRQWLSDDELGRQVLSLQFFDPAAEVPDPEDYYQVSLGATWLVFNGFQRHFSIAASRFGKMETEAAWRDAQRLMLSGVASLYYSAQLERENIAIATADLDYNKRLLEEAQVKRRVGTGSLSEELNFQVRMNAARTQLFQSERRYQVARIGLAAIMGVPDATVPAWIQLAPLGEERPEELRMPPVKELMQSAFEYRPDFQQSEYALDRNRANIGAAKAEYFPTVSVFGEVNGFRSNSGDFDEDDFGKQVGVQLSYPLFTGFARKARVDLAKAQREEAERVFDQKIINISEDIHSALAQLNEAQQQLVLQRENVVLVERTRELVEVEYDAGQTSLVRLNEAQRDVITARGNLAQARVGLRRAWSLLEEATGQILSPFVEEY